MMRCTRLLVVSPHPDDAALSLGASLLKYAEWRPVVWDIFTQQNYSILDSAPDQAQCRILSEERAAAHALGVEVVLGGFPEAELRGHTRLSQRLGRHWLELLDVPEEVALLHRVADAFDRILAQYSPRWVALPLGVGGHVDHLLAREAVLSRLAPTASHKGPRAFLYEDLPYATHASWLQSTIAELSSQGRRLRPHRVDVTGLLDQKRKVLELYRSQLRERDIRHVLDYSKTLDKYETERIWRQ